MSAAAPAPEVLAGRHLPVAEASHVRRATLRLIRRDGRAFTIMIVLNALAATAGLVGPWLLGDIVDTVKRAVNHPAVGHPVVGDAVSTVDRLAVIIIVATLAQVFLARYALLVAYRFGERTATMIREQFLGRALALPASVVERVVAGDLTARGTADVDTVATTLRDAIPDVLISAVQCLFIFGAVFVIDPLLGACGLLGLAVIWVVTRWYLRRARTAYLAQGAASSVVADVLTTTVAGARTVEALGLQQRRIAACRDAVDESRRTRMRTLFLRSVLFPTIDISYVIPVVGVLLIGGALYDHGAITLGAVMASALYLRQLAGPLDAILMWVEQLQSSSASFARIEGLNQVPARVTVNQATVGQAIVGQATLGQVNVSEASVPTDDRIDVSDVRYAYDSGRDVLHGVDLTVRPGERLAVVGPSGAGKSTLGRLLAGIDRPRTGAVTVGGVPIADLTPDRLRRQVVLVTQEHHVFRDSIRDNLLIAKPSATDAEVRGALATVGADWIRDAPNGLDTELGGTDSDGTVSAFTVSAGAVSAGTDPGGTDSGGTDSGGTDPGGTDPGGTDSGGAGRGGAGSGGADSDGTDSGAAGRGGAGRGGADSDGAGSGGAGSGGAGSGGAGSGGAGSGGAGSGGAGSGGAGSGRAGFRLDGAQAQQLALARVVLADPHTLILDEATALLDPTTARNTERALAAVLDGRTVIAIAHRLQTAHDADRVAVMDGGRVTELGTHDDLVAADGAYAALWHSWHGDDRHGDDRHGDDRHSDDLHSDDLHSDDRHGDGPHPPAVPAD